MINEFDFRGPYLQRNPSAEIWGYPHHLWQIEVVKQYTIGGQGSTPKKHLEHTFSTGRRDDVGRVEPGPAIRLNRLNMVGWGSAGLGSEKRTHDTLRRNPKRYFGRNFEHVFLWCTWNDRMIARIFAGSPAEGWTQSTYLHNTCWAWCTCFSCWKATPRCFLGPVLKFLGAVRHVAPRVLADCGKNMLRKYGFKGFYAHKIVRL